MRLPQLHDALVQAAEAQEASQQRGSRPRKRAVLLGSLAAALLCAAGAAAVLYAGDSKPLVGNLAQGPNGRASKYTIQVFPMMTAGWAGWCTVAVFAEGSSTRTTVYGCGPVEGEGPLIAGGEEFANRRHAYTLGVVSRDVAYVRLPEGSLIRTITEPDLPLGTRAYFSPTHLPHKSPDERRSVTYLDASRRQIPVPNQPAVQRLQASSAPSDPRARTRCQITTRPRRSLRLLSQTAVQAQPWSRHQTGAFLACANATYRFGTAQIALAMLVNANAPAQPAAPLPAVRRDPRYPGLFEGQGLGNLGFPAGLAVADFSGEAPVAAAPAARSYASHDITARRAGHAWLIAEGGTSPERVSLLGAASARFPGAG
jgi:hypothetical protein